MQAVLVLLIFCLLAVLLWFVDRSLLKAEERGWIYWRKKRGRSDRLGQAFLDLQSMLEPLHRHVLEETRRDHDDKACEGAPPA